MNTQIRKDSHGWQAETRLPLDCGRHLSITTRKGNSGLRSGVQVYRIENGFMTFVMFGDYSATLAKSDARATEKTVTALHEQALAKLEEVKAAVTAFYAGKGE